MNLERKIELYQHGQCYIILIYVDYTMYLDMLLRWGGRITRIAKTVGS